MAFPDPHRFARIVSKRLRFLAKVRKAAEGGFETAPSVEYYVRRMEIVNHVSKELRIPASPKLCSAVKAAVSSLGWEAVSPQNRSYFRWVKPRGMSDEAALRASKAERAKTK